MGELAMDITSGPVYICHGDCEEDANVLAGHIKDMYGLDVEIITYTGPVIGCHSGPGTLALFFIGKER
jgi:fatty acid-binding protein DegV